MPKKDMPMKPMMPMPKAMPKKNMPTKGKGC